MFSEVGLKFDRSFTPDEQLWEGYSDDNEEDRYRYNGETVDAIWAS